MNTAVRTFMFIIGLDTVWLAAGHELPNGVVESLTRPKCPTQHRTMSKPAQSPNGVPIEQTQRILNTLLHPDMRDNPLAYVMYAFPWGVKGTPLAKFPGPAKWQVDELKAMTAHIAENRARLLRDENPVVYRSAVASGRGIGKSALVAWISLWMLSCHPGSTTQISANTDDQLTNKTFAELGKWLTMAINGYFFDRNVKKIMPASWYSDAMKKQLKLDDTYFYVHGVLWDPDNPASFAGIHSDIGVMLIFDEASGIPTSIWTESEGFFTEKTVYRFWFAFSNPRRNSGAFYDCFNEHREFWRTRNINAMEIETQYSDKALYDGIIRKYGETSDEAKVHVYGEFPNQSDHQFIPRGLVTEARYRALERYDDTPALVMGCDPARYGSDATVIRFRRGRDARVIPPIELFGKDNMFVANKCAELIDEYDPDGVFIDAGAGAGVIDRLKEMGYKVFEVGFGTASTDPQYWDHRTELWARMREWLAGAMIDANPKLLVDLCAPEWGPFGKEDRVKLESQGRHEKTRREVARPRRCPGFDIPC